MSQPFRKKKSLFAIGVALPRLLSQLVFIEKCCPHLTGFCIILQTLLPSTSIISDYTQAVQRNAPRKMTLAQLACYQHSMYSSQTLRRNGKLPKQVPCSRGWQSHLVARALSWNAKTMHFVPEDATMLLK